MARFLVDENFPLAVTEELRRLGHKVETLLELGKAGQGFGDSEVLALATERSGAVLTCLPTAVERQFSNRVVFVRNLGDLQYLL